jgi:hypothetical protein
MRWGLGILLVSAAACSSFGGSGDDPTVTPGDGGVEGGGDDGGAADSPSATPYVSGAIVSCDNVDGGLCTVPTFCCVNALGPNYCATTGCDTRDLSKLACRDDTACGAGYLCCVQVDRFHVTASTCEKSCDVARDAGNGNGEFHACGAGGKAACNGGSCVSLQNALEANVTPDPELNVCR